MSISKKTPSSTKTARIRTGIGVGAAASLVWSAALVFSGNPAAATLTSSDGYTTLNTIGTVTAGTPYSSGQIIDLNVAANPVISASSLFTAGTPGCTQLSAVPPPTYSCSGNYYVEECTDSGGLIANLPTAATGCEAATLSTGGKNSDGHLALTGTGGFTIYDLPDPGTLGLATMTGTCDVNPNQCVLGIFAQNPQAGNGFAFPHLFSAPFNVDPQSDFGSGVETGLNPGDGSAPVVTTPLPTSVSTSLSGGAQSGTSISVPTSTAVTDTATLSGTNASTATGTVTYNVYTDSGCATLAPGGGGTA